MNSFGRVCGGRRRRRRPATHAASAAVLRLELLVWRARAETQARDKQPWCGKATLELLAPPWPNGQGVGLLIRRLRVRVPLRVFLSRVQVCRRCGACALPGVPVAGAEVDLLDVSGVRKVRAVVSPALTHLRSEHWNCTEGRHAARAPQDKLHTSANTMKH